MNHYVYEITNLVNGKKYIGKRSCKCPIEDDKYMGSGKLLKLAIGKYGIENFRKMIVAICGTEEDAYEQERILINVYNAVDNKEYYNLSEGGLGFSSDALKQLWKNEKYRKKIELSLSKRWEDKDFRERQSKKISESKKGNKNPMYGLRGEKNHNFGKTLTKEHKQKLGNSKRGKYKNEKNWNSVKVIRVNDLRIFNSIVEAKEVSKQRTEANIVACCKGKREYAGKINGEPAKWMYYDEYIKLSDEEKDIISNYVKNIKLNSIEGRKIICLTNCQIFENIKDAEIKYGIPHSNIIKVCKGERKSAGKINGEPARWMYYEDYLNMKNKKA